jgi:hypothetical protein
MSTGDDVFGDFGIVAARWVLSDTFIINRYVTPALKVGGPLSVVFFSVIGLGCTTGPVDGALRGNTGQLPSKYIRRLLLTSGKNYRLGDSLCQ